MPPRLRFLERSKHYFSLQSGVIVGGLLITVLATAGHFLVSTKTVLPTEAGGSQVQMAVGTEKRTNHISASFIRDPKPGNLLVAILSTRDPSTFTQPKGWNIAIDELNEAPGQAVLYRIAGESESRSLELWVNRTSTLGLQLLEYAGIDSQRPFIAAGSDTGHGRVMHSGAVKTEAEETLLLAAVTADQRGQFRTDWSENFTLRQFERSLGKPSITVGFADKLAKGQGGHASAAMLNKQARWRGQILAFRRLSGAVASAIDTDEPSVDLALSTTVSDEEPESATEVTFATTITNNGVVPATDIAIQAKLPRKVLFAGSSATQGSYQPGLGIWRIGNLDPSMSAMLTIRGLIDDSTAGSTFLHPVELVGANEFDSNNENNRSAGAIDVKQGSVLVEDVCEAVDNVSFTLNENAGEVIGRDLPVTASGTNASFVLLSEEPRRITGKAFALDEPILFKLSEEPGEKRVFAWIGNACSYSVVQFKEITQLSEPEPEESVEEEITGEAEEEVIVDEEGVESNEEAEEEAIETEEEEEISLQTPEATETCQIEAEFVSFLERGMSSEEIRALQELLACLGYFPGDIEANAVFGPTTEASVAAFQEARGIEGVGYVGPATRAELNFYFVN